MPPRPPRLRRRRSDRGDLSARISRGIAGGIVSGPSITIAPKRITAPVIALIVAVERPGSSGHGFDQRRDDRVVIASDFRMRSASASSSQERAAMIRPVRALPSPFRAR